MTECERLIKDGFLPKEFFKEETRNDFLVDNKRKKIWAIELDMLMKLLDVCRKHNIKIFLGGGSLLGAIRHGGFIPWDDDIDVCMLRDDYEKLTKELCHEFQEPYFLQTPYTDDGYYFSFAKLRNSRTSDISDAFLYENFNQGLCIDIFPVDNCIVDDVEQRYNLAKELITDNSAYMRKSLKNPSVSDMEKIKKHSGRDPLEVYEQIDANAKKYYEKNTPYVCCMVCTIFSWKNGLYNKNVFDKAINWNFEGFDVPVPIGYEEILSTHYGDWRQLPPIEKRGTWHNSETMDPDISYTELSKILRKEDK